MKQLLPIFIAIIAIVTVTISISLNKKSWTYLSQREKKIVVITVLSGFLLLVVTFLFGINKP
jgi:small-conductance mechanosensitive channel